VGMGVVDTVVVGQLAPHELAHQALGWTLNGPALLGGVGLLLGVQVQTARAIGGGATAGLGVVWRRGIVIGLVAGAVVCILIWTSAAAVLQGLGVAVTLARRGAAVAAVLTLSIPSHLAFMASAKMLEALERPTPAALAMWIANGANLALNLALVPGGGAIGSAWATVLSRLLLALALPVYMMAVGPVRRLLAGPAAVGRFGYGPLMRIGAAAALSGLVEAGAFSAMAVIAARHGGAVAVAVFTVATGSLLTLVYLLAQGFATAAVVLVSEAIGAGDERAAGRIGWSALALTLAAMAASGAGCLAFSPQLARAFTADGATQAGLVSTMGLIALLMVPDGGQGPADATLRARGDNWFPTAARFTAFVVLAPSLAIWLAPRMARPAEGVLLALLIASAVALAALVARMAAVPSSGRTQRGQNRLARPAEAGTGRRK